MKFKIKDIAKSIDEKIINYVENTSREISKLSYDEMCKTEQTTNAQIKSTYQKAIKRGVALGSGVLFVNIPMMFINPKLASDCFLLSLTGFGCYGLYNTYKLGNMELKLAIIEKKIFDEKQRNSRDMDNLTQNVFERNKDYTLNK